MSSWDDYRQVCIHGVLEDLGWHACKECADIARKAGKKVIPRRETFIVTKENRASWERELSKKGWVYDQDKNLVKKSAIFKKSLIS